MVSRHGTPWAITLLALLVLAAGAPGTVRAAFECSAITDRTSVPAGGEIMLKVTAEGDVGWSADFDLPDLGVVKVHDGGTNQSMTMVNGRTRTSVSRTWYLRVPGQADFTIPSVTVTASGETCRTEPIAIKVTARVPVTPDVTGNRVAPPPTASGATAPRTGDEIFVTLETDKSEIWIGEQVILSFRYWRRIQPWNNPSYTAPRTVGFWREELGPERTSRQVLDGRAYNVTEIRYALFPTRTGDLVIEPASLAFPEDVFDRFFSTRRRSRGPRTLRTDPVTVTVRPLPTPGPDGYSGLVANSLQLVAEVDRDTVPQGEPVGWKVHLAADGFLKGFDGLKVVGPGGARLHDAAEDFATDLRGDRLRSRIDLEKVIVPEDRGDLTVPPVELVWFDAGAARYRTARTSPARVVVTPGERPGGGERESSGFMRSEIARLGDDLAFIHPMPRSLGRGEGPFTGSPLWWALLAAPIVLLGMWRLALRRWSHERRDPARRRRRQALATAKESLGAVVKDPGPAAASLVVRAVVAYVADCTDEPVAAVAAAEVRAYAAGLGLEETGEELVELLDRCDTARFGGGAEVDPREQATLARKALESLAAARRSGGGSRVALMMVLSGALLVAAGVGAGGIADPARLLAEGNQAYTEGDLDLALVRYLAVGDAGVNDPVLHFNLGTTHARRGELGLALASLERARRLAPRDGDIAANIAWVRRHLQDLELAGDELPLFIGQFVSFQRMFTLDQWGSALLVILWPLALVVGWAWYRERFDDHVRRLALVLAALVLACTAITAWRWYGERVVTGGVVVMEEVAVRSGPASTFGALFQVHDGLAVRVDGEREGWVRISLGGDWEGWLPVDAVTFVDQQRAQGR